ncbi:MAG: hypothetical protein GY774_22575 [Planctomycetes bacterium]|nr:hypothetical protein [Planctomycetota bacterium]|tara:strand:- start:18947 stop:19324 length:378 start_codon:yes stop_codon:yes gene_type:complete
MFKPLSKVLVVVAMLTAFVGQAFAYTSMSCEMSADSHQSHMTMEHSSMKSHEGMEHGDMKASASSSKDCCDVDCICPANACTSVTFLNSNNGSPDILGFTEAIVNQGAEHPKSMPTSLFRPPIFA